MTEMGRLEFTTPKEAWGGEAEAFTPLLAQEELMSYLGEETGIGPLLPIETEHTTAGNRSLDILAETADGRRVAIENQYGRGDHDHLTRGLAYAVATGSKALIVVAEDHRDEFISVADYLNDVAGADPDSSIRVWLVKVRAVRRSGDEVWSPEFVVQAEPNEWEAAIRRETGPVFSSLEEFYEKCADTDVAWAATAADIITAWLERPGTSEFHGNRNTVSLYLCSPRHPDGGTNVFQLYTSGHVAVCRGYVWQSSDVFDPESEPIELDEKIRKYFPDAHWPGKQMFIRTANPDVARTGEFLDWVVDRFSAALGIPSLGTSDRPGI